MSETAATDWIPKEVPKDHWSKDPEWLEYKRKQAELLDGKPENTLAPFQKVATVNQGTRQKNTHEIQMESCKVEWIDPTPVEEANVLPAAAIPDSVTNEDLEEIAKTILARINEAVPNA